MTSEYTIRECTTIEDFAGCINLQRVVWQFEDLDVTPVRGFVVARNSGGFTYGAFDAHDQMVGFAHALPAFTPEQKPYYYSQMMAVLSHLRNTGIGARLKLAQRDHALRTGIPLITWTFDPLQSRNAYLNIIKLGGVVRTYKINFYGHASSSTLHRGLDTDRLFVEWWVNSQHVADAVAGKRRTDAPVASVEVPRDIEAIKHRNMQEAQNWQAQIRAGFQKYLSEGLYCAGFETDADGGHSRYLFYQDEHQEEKESARG